MAATKGLEGAPLTLGLGRHPRPTLRGVRIARAAAAPAFPTGIKWKTVAQASADRKFHRLQTPTKGDSGTFADRMIIEGRSLRGDRGHDDRQHRGRRQPRATSISVRNIRMAVEAMNAAITQPPSAAATLGAPAIGGSNHSFRSRRSGSVPAPMSCGEETSLPGKPRRPVAAPSAPKPPLPRA